VEVDRARPITTRKSTIELTRFAGPVDRQPDPSSAHKSTCHAEGAYEAGGAAPPVATRIVNSIVVVDPLRSHAHCRTAFTGTIRERPFST
jgi:hypothetical protein